jgi:hypothetical protein
MSIAEALELLERDGIQSLKAVRHLSDELATGFVPPLTEKAMRAQLREAQLNVLACSVLIEHLMTNKVQEVH